MADLIDLLNELESDLEVNVLIQNELNAGKIQELKQLIERVSNKYGGDDEDFLKKYIDDVIYEWSHDLDAALRCFRGLV